MKITLTKHGGIAAGIRRQPKVLDISDLLQPPELTQLVAAVQNAPALEEANPGSARDAMSYTIMVEDNGRRTILKQSDTTMSPAFAALLTWLERHFAAN